MVDHLRCGAQPFRLRPARGRGCHRGVHGDFVTGELIGPGNNRARPAPAISYTTGSKALRNPSYSLSLFFSCVSPSRPETSILTTPEFQSPDRPLDVFFHQSFRQLHVPFFD